MSTDLSPGFLKTSSLQSSLLTLSFLLKSSLSQGQQEAQGQGLAVGVLGTVTMGHGKTKEEKKENRKNASPRSRPGSWGTRHCDYGSWKKQIRKKRNQLRSSSIKA